MFDDSRSKKIILVAHCTLNQNAKLDRCAHHPGAVREVAQTLIDSGIGLLQMQCPELMSLGLARDAAQDSTPTVEEEDSRIAARMSQTDAGLVCQRLIDGLAYQIEEYRRHGFQILGVLGVNGSPSCGVETTWYGGEEHAGPGVFIAKLQAELDRRGVSVAMRGFRAYRATEAVAAVEDLLG